MPRPPPASAATPFALLAAGIAALAVAMGVGRFAFTPLLPPMQAALGFGNDTAGWLASANHAGYLAGALGAAWLPARWRRREVAWICLVAVVATTAAMAATDSMPVWFALRATTGVASAGVLVFASALTLDALRRQGRADLAGAHFGGVGLGIALSGLLLAAAGEYLGWRGGWLAVAAMSVALLPFCRGLPRDGHRAEAAAGSGTRAAAAPAFAAAALIAAYFLQGAGYIVTGTFLVAIAKADPALAPHAAWFWILVGLAGIPSVLMWAAAARRWGAWRALVLAYLIQAAGVALPAIWTHPAAAGLSGALLGGTFMGITALTLPLGASATAMRADRMIGILTAAFGVGQIVGPVVAGSMAAAEGSFSGALLLASLALALGGALLLPFCRRRQ